MAKASPKKKSSLKKGSVEEPSRFVKEQLMSSKRYADLRDLLDMLLMEGKQYATAEVDALLEAFLKGKVIG